MFYLFAGLNEGWKVGPRGGVLDLVARHSSLVVLEGLLKAEDTENFEWAHIANSDMIMVRNFEVQDAVLVDMDTIH